MAKEEPVLFEAYAREWFERARVAKLSALASYESILEHHLIPVFGEKPMREISREDYRAWLRRLKDTETRRGGPPAPCTVRNVNSVLRTIFRDAVDDKVVESSPVKPGRHGVPPQADADPAWRQDAIFTREEVRLLMTSPRLAERERVAFALEFFLGPRAGELAGLTWGSWQDDEPLSAMHIVRAWNTSLARWQPPKNGRPRKVPVHPTLAVILSEWSEGWAREYGRKPKDSDLLVMASPGYPLRNDRAWKWITRACGRLGIRERGSHIARATFVTLCQEGGAEPAIVERISHGSPSRDVEGGRVLAGYSRYSWPVLCEALMCLRFDLE